MKIIKKKNAEKTVFNVVQYMCNRLYSLSPNAARQWLGPPMPTACGFLLCAFRC